MTDKELVQVLRHCGTPGNNCDGCTKEWECYHEMEVHPMVIAAERLETLAAENEHFREVTKMMQQWVSVEERLPELTENERYCVKHYGFLYAPEYIVKITYSERPTTLLYDGAEWFDVEGVPYTVTHWMPLPEFREEDENGA